jgi:hypothetical protein
MKRSVVGGAVFVVVVAAAIAGATGAGAAQQMTTVNVTVVDQSGETVGNVDLQVSWDDGEETRNVTTLSNGNAYFDVPRGADIEVRVTDDEYLRNEPATFENVRGDDGFEVEVSLPGTVRVAVTDVADGDAISGAEAELDGRGITVTNETDEEGIAVLGPVERGEYDLEVTEAGYLQNETTVEIQGDENETITLEEADRQLSVTVVDDHFEPPEELADASVRIEGVATLQTGNNGQRSTNVGVNSEYRLTVTKEGYGETRRTVNVYESDRSVTVAIRRQDSLSVAANSDRVVVGETTELTVTDEYGERVPNATVSVEEVGETDAQGTYDLSVDSAGNLTVSVSDGDASASITVEGFQPGGPDTPAETETPTETTSGGGLPGFGPLTAVVAVVALAVVVAVAARARDT